MVSSTRPAHTRLKPIHRSIGMSSPKTNSARRNCRIGARYCSSPMVLRGSLRAAAPKKISGTAVMTPEAAMIQKWPGPSAVSVAAPVELSQIITPAAIGVSRAVSMLRLDTASTLGPTRFLTKPYSPKVNARISAIHGTEP